MRFRRGQVAIYLVLVLVAIVLLTLSSVGTYLAVTARNRLMNAGDAAALAVAKHQGALLNEIGRLNVDHLRAALANDFRECERLQELQARRCFLGPLEGIRIGNEAAAANGADPSDGMLGVLRRHVDEIRREYTATPEFYPAPWPGAWEEYAAALEDEIGGGLVAGPDNIDFLDANGGHLLCRKQFYNAVEGGNWCWFHFHAMGAVEDWEGYLASSPLPVGDEDTRQRKCVNSEVYSLGLEAVAGSAVELLGPELIRRLTGCTERELEDSRLIRDRGQCWFFYDEGSYSAGWRRWTELSDEIDGSAYAGRVRDEFNVRGCSAVCRVAGGVPDLGTAGSATAIEWNAAAKPFGCVTGEDGSPAPVTALRGFVTPAFESVRLVAVGSVGGMDISSCDPDWSVHVREHVPVYLQRGREALAACRYCAVLARWDDDATRRTAREWLRVNSGSCRVVSGHGPKGGANPPH